jgi:cellulose synthase/poly-beta-1,6-N-acetylglucosamine synthase-like glycosyltransferase
VKPLELFGSLLVAWLVVFTALEALIGAAWPLQLSLVFVGWELAVTVVLVVVLRRRVALERRRPAVGRGGARPAVSVLIAAWNEAGSIAATVERWTSQRGLEFEVLVGDDGSADETAARLVSAGNLKADRDGEFCGQVNGIEVRLVRLAHAGKGATLNALARRARHPVLVTTDADTTPAPEALALLAEAFRGDAGRAVDCATGVVSIRNARSNWLLAQQSMEYVKTVWARIAWSSLGVLEQVPGALTAVRAERFHEVGGFPTDSLTEDYELTFRLMARRPPVVVTVLGAQVFTDGPSTVRGFVRQRTRWFAGFVSTLVRFRALLFNPAAGAYGLIRLPLKLVDVFLPLFTLVGVVDLVVAGTHGLARLSLTLFAVRWLWEMTVAGLALAAAPLLGDRELSARASPSPVMLVACVTLEAFGFAWLRQFAALRGLAWALARVQTWEPSRDAPTLTS